MYGANKDNEFNSKTPYGAQGGYQSQETKENLKDIPDESDLEQPEDVRAPPATTAPDPAGEGFDSDYKEVKDQITSKPSAPALKGPAKSSQGAQQFPSYGNPNLNVMGNNQGNNYPPQGYNSNQLYPQYPSQPQPQPYAGNQAPMANPNFGNQQQKPIMPPQNQVVIDPSKPLPPGYFIRDGQVYYSAELARQSQIQPQPTQKEVVVVERTKVIKEEKSTAQKAAECACCSLIVSCICCCCLSLCH